MSVQPKASQVNKTKAMTIWLGRRSFQHWFNSFFSGEFQQIASSVSVALQLLAMTGSNVGAQ